jgi:hypothetical protein
MVVGRKNMNIKQTYYRNSPTRKERRKYKFLTSSKFFVIGFETIYLGNT